MFLEPLFYSPFFGNTCIQVITFTIFNGVYDGFIFCETIDSFFIKTSTFLFGHDFLLVTYNSV